ncbi:MAG: hypothetical protein ABIQ32_06595 [Sphingomicrobium sp.]
MTDRETSAAAERMSRRRARVLPILAFAFLTQQAAYFSGPGFGTGDRAVDHVRISAWLVMSVVLLVVLATGGGWIYGREVRRIANDEATRAHRDDAFRWGFIVTISAALISYVASMYEAASAQEAIHVIVTAGMLTALLRFAFLERRAMRDA